jgi:hypothetical protein
VTLYTGPRIGLGRDGGNLVHDFPAVHFRLSADKAPRIRIETSELLLNCEKRPRIAHGRLDFLPVSNNACVQQQLLDAFLCMSRHFVGIELAESAAIAFTLVQDDRPAQSGLRPFQNKELFSLQSASAIAGAIKWGHSANVLGFEGRLKITRRQQMKTPVNASIAGTSLKATQIA